MEILEMSHMKKCILKCKNLPMFSNLLELAFVEVWLRPESESEELK